MVTLIVGYGVRVWGGGAGVRLRLRLVKVSFTDYWECSAPPPSRIDVMCRVLGGHAKILPSPNSLTVPRLLQQQLASQPQLANGRLALFDPDTKDRKSVV